MLLKLKMAILNSGRHQYEVAHDAGIPETRLSRIILGRVDPSAEERRCIARALRATERDLFDGQPGKGGDE